MTARMTPAKMMAIRLVVVGVMIFSAVGGIRPVSTGAQTWPAIFDPLQLLTINLDMDPADWTAIQNDATFLIEAPAQLWMAGETPVLVTVRRKSSDPLTGSPSFDKVALKVDINQLVPGQLWHGLSKLSLENGDDVDVIAEGLAWYVHNLASGPEGYNYAHSVGLAAWVKLNINGIDTGVYISPEQRNKRMLKNRTMWDPATMWLYKNASENLTELKGGPLTWSPAYQTLCYFPFMDAATCSPPSAATLATQLPALIDMQAMLAMGAANAFIGNPDGLFAKGQNSYFVDFVSGVTRMYYPWDLDAVLSKKVGVFPTGSYADLILAVPEFRDQYMEIMYRLITGPWAEADLVAFLNAAEALLTTALVADPNNQIPPGETVATRFDELRNWISQRTVEVLNVLPACDLQPGVLDFGTVSASKDTTFVISNNGAEPMTGNVSELCDPYEVISGGGPFTLAPGGSLPVQVRFAPTTSGVQNCTVEIGTAFCAGVAVTGTGDVATGIDTKVPSALTLRQNHPNPFNRTTRIGFDLHEAATVTLDVYDVSGKLVRRLVDRGLPSGTYAEVWDGRDVHGNKVASGIYLYRLTAGSHTFTRKAILLR